MTLNTAIELFFITVADTRRLVLVLVKRRIFRGNKHEMQQSKHM